MRSYPVFKEADSGQIAEGYMLEGMGITSEGYGGLA